MNKKFFLLTDTLPYELPLIYSNKLLFEFINNSSEWESVDILSSNEKTKDPSEPYNFFIFKNDNSKRMIGLVHPLGQLHMQKFIEKYDTDLIDFMNMQSIYSLRYPTAINSLSINKIDKIKKELSSMLDEDSEIINNDHEEFLDSYFQKKKFIRITDFYKSHLFKKLEIKYSLLLKMDISNCFYNIYSHSIDWAYLGDKYLAKSYRDKNKRFSSQIDKLMQSINFGETNGIVVGPEFSRCVAEIVLSRIDNMVYTRLKEQKIIYKNDYEIVRYMDDIFAFGNSEKTLEFIIKAYQECCLEYKLSINEKKVSLEKRPFLRKHSWVIKLKKVLKTYFEQIKNAKNLNRGLLEYININLIDEIRCIIMDYEDQKHSIVSFLLAYLERKIRNTTMILDSMDNEKNKIYLINKIIDVVHYCLIFSITSSNVIKYSKLTYLLSRYSEKFKDQSVDDLLFKKALELLKYHSEYAIELLNIIIILKRFNKDIPQEILFEILTKNESTYFTYSTILFYINTEQRKYSYSKIRNYINKNITTFIKEIHEDLEVGLQSKDKNRPRKDILSSSNFYLIHDLYSHPLITSKTKNEIKILKKELNKVQRKNQTVFKVFLDYIEGFDKPFMNWDATDDQLIATLIRKDARIDSSFYK